MCSFGQKTDMFFQSGFIRELLGPDGLDENGKVVLTIGPVLRVLPDHLQVVLALSVLLEEVDVEEVAFELQRLEDQLGLVNGLLHQVYHTYVQVLLDLPEGVLVDEVPDVLEGYVDEQNFVFFVEVPVADQPHLELQLVFLEDLHFFRFYLVFRVFQDLLSRRVGRLLLLITRRPEDVLVVANFL